MRLPILISIFVIALYSCNDNQPTVIAEENEFFQVIEKIKVGIDDVRDLEYNGTYFFILTPEIIYTVDKKGKIISTKGVKNITGLCYDENRKKLLMISDKMGIETAETGEIILKPDTAYMAVEDKNPFYLCYDNENFYSAIIYGDYKKGQMSFSSQISSIDSKGKHSYFYVLTGWPAGLDCYNECIWFNAGSLFNSSFSYDSYKCFLTKFDFSGFMISEEEIPVDGAIGIAFDKSGEFYVYSRRTEVIMKVRRK